MTAKNRLTVERTIGFRGRIWTGLSAPETQKAGRQNGGDFGQVVSRVLGRHAPLKGSVQRAPNDFT
jgi:hypothetical protein